MTDTSRSAPIRIGQAALLSSAGPAAIAVIRVTGTGTVAPLCGLLGKPALPSQDIFRAGLRAGDGELIDDILVVVSSRNSAAWTIELHLHGNPWLVDRALLELATAGFARDECAIDNQLPMVDPLERDALEQLPQILTATGAAWLLAQPSRLRHELRRMRDFDADQYPLACRQLLAGEPIVGWFSKPLRVAIVGAPNAGKSTLINRLAGSGVSIVSSTAGTTRDWVEAATEHAGYPITWIDTAGLRDTDDALEAESIARALALLGNADALIVVVDSTRPETAVRLMARLPHMTGLPAIIAWNKIDVPGAADIAAAWQRTHSSFAPMIGISASTGAGLPTLLDLLFHALKREPNMLDRPAVFHPRHAQLLQGAAERRDAKSARAKLECAVLGHAAPPDPA